VVGELRDRDQEADVGALQVRLRQQLGVVTHEVVFIPARTIAKTSSGKIARHRVRQHWEEGSLEVLARVRVQDPGRFPEVDGGSVAPHGGESGEDRWVTDASAVGSLVEHYGLDRWDGRALGDVGLDSIQIAELGHDLKGWLTALGHDELTDQLDLRLLQQIAVSELVELCEQLSEAAPQAKFQFHQAFARLQVAHQEAERALMRRDARFDLELEPPPVGRLMPVATPAGSDLLLTGGTGFLGPFMLRSLLVQHPEATIHVLLRAQDPEAGRWRLRKGFEALGSLAPKPGWEARMHPICGDLARPDLGLAPEVWRSLTTRVGTVVHNGALVNYLHDYGRMRDANVGGTKAMVRLALEAQAELNHISTTFIFGWSAKDVLFEHDCNVGMERLDFGYSQSKWVAEQVVLDAMQRCGLKARIFRPALITPSVEGYGSNMDIAIRLLVFMVKHGLGTTAPNQVSFSPADQVADNIVAIANLPDTLGQTYHITRDRYANMGDITRIMGDQVGRHFEHLPLEQFVPEVVERCQKDDPLFPLLNFLVRSIDNITAMEFKRYDNSNTQRDRARTSLGRSDVPLTEVVSGMVRFMRARGLIVERQTRSDDIVSGGDRALADGRHHG
ncbi:MAG: SDR family oxidoreductase, partial [Myxococcota bacterium]